MSASAGLTGWPASVASSSRRTGVRGHEAERDQAHGVDARRPTTAVPGEAAPTTMPATAGPMRLADRRADHALEAVDGQQVGLGDQRGQPGGVGRVVERHRGADHERDEREVPDRGGVGRATAPRPAPCRPAPRAQTASRIVFCGTRSATTPASSAGSSTPIGTAGGDDRELGRAAADPDDLPDQGDQPDALPERARNQRHRQPAVAGVRNGVSARGSERPRAWSSTVSTTASTTGSVMTLLLRAVSAWMDRQRHLDSSPFSGSDHLPGRIGA